MEQRRVTLGRVGPGLFQLHNDIRRNRANTVEDHADRFCVAGESHMPEAAAHAAAALENGLGIGE